MEEKNKKIPDWIRNEEKKLEEERLAQLKAAGLRPIFRLPEGETEVKVVTEEEPTETNTQYGPRKLVPIRVENEDYALPTNPKGKLYRDIIRALSNGSDKVKILRTGTGIDTEYKVTSI